jgi:hypothetical protein
VVWSSTRATPPPVAVSGKKKNPETLDGSAALLIPTRPLAADTCGVAFFIDNNSKPGG